MKIVFFGNGKRAFICLKYLIEESQNIVGVVGIPNELDQENTILSLAIDNNIPITHWSWYYPASNYVYVEGVKTTSANYDYSSTQYGEEFISVVENQNIIGVQFHPEKSHKNGLQLLKNFIMGYSEL